MSDEEKVRETQETGGDTVGENTSEMDALEGAAEKTEVDKDRKDRENELETDHFEDKIEAAMARIVQETSADPDDRREYADQADETEWDPDDDDDDDDMDEVRMVFLRDYRESLGQQGASQTAKEEKKGKSEKSKQEKEDRKSSNNQTQPEKPVRSARPQPLTYVPMAKLEEAEEEPVKKHKFLKVTGLLAAMLAVSAVTAYAGVSYYYSDRFFNGTVINGIDCSNKTAYEVEQEIAEKLSGYSIEVQSRGMEAQVIDGEKINYRYMSNGEVLQKLKDQKIYEWPKGYYEPTVYTVEENTVFDKEKLQQEVRQLECAKAENQEEPENAYVAYIDKEFQIVPETEGSALILKNAYHAVEDAIAGGDAVIDFSAEPDVYEQAAVTADSTELQATVDACNNFAKASITYDLGNTEVVLDGSTIKDWLQFDDKNQLVQNDASLQQHVSDFVAQLAAEYDTVGTSREFYSTNGRAVYVYGSSYGWKIDQAAEVAELIQEIQSGAQTYREPNYSMRANSRGINDFGDTYIEVDMGVQHMYYYRNGYIIFDSEFVSGDINYPDRATPEGIYTLYFKASPSVLRGPQDENGKYEYETPVTYWMPFNGGVGFHDAEWQPYFGGTRYMEGGSHGCINLPYWAAAELYEIIEYGVPIICFY